MQTPGVLQFSPSAVHRFIVENYHVPADGFTLHRFHPEDFLLVFKEVVVLERVLHAPPLPVADMVLRFRRWRRLASADAESMKFRVLLEMRGIPSHVWSVDTAQRILGDACADPVPTPATIARRDLRRFQAAAWCVDPDLIPNEVVIRIPEPVDRNVVPSSSSGRRKSSFTVNPFSGTGSRSRFWKSKTGMTTPTRLRVRTTSRIV